MTSAGLLCSKPACKADFCLARASQSCRVVSATSTVVSGARPTSRRSAPMAGHPTPRLDLRRSSVVPVSGQGGVPPWPNCTRPRLADASPPAASWRGLDAAAGGSGVVCRRQSLALGGSRTPPLTLSRFCKACQCARLGFAPRKSARGIGQCCASVSLCAGAQTGCPARCASC